MGLVRLFLALVVAEDHWRVFMLRPRSVGLEDLSKLGFNAGYAVMFFYIVSGFLITYTLSRNYERNAAGVLAFYKNRFVRIFSLYWPIALVAILLVPHTWATFLAASLPDQLTSIFLVGVDWRVAFASYPATHFAAMLHPLPQTWTLGAELSFYLAAPFLMRWWKIGAALLIASFAMRAYFVASYGTDQQAIWTYHFIGTSFGFFMLGHLVCKASNRWRLLLSPILGWVLLAASLWTMAFAGSYASYDTPRFWGATLLFTLALPGLFEATKNVRWMNMAGDLSYPAYLVHTLLLYLVAPWLITFVLPIEHLGVVGAGHFSVAAFFCVTLVAAFLAHRLLEIPTAHAMRTVLSARKLRSA
jgi:peptidoglycan/LPS O-acetylase OafA/YrhL